jgi:intein/homing endonuclease
VTGEAIGCLFLTCFATDTHVQIIKNGIPTIINIDSLKAGDRVLTIDSGVLTYTKVEWVKKTEAADGIKHAGGFEFVKVEVEGWWGDSLEVTKDHGLLVVGGDGKVRLKSAGAVSLGDELPTVSQEVWRANSSRVEPGLGVVAGVRVRVGGVGVVGGDVMRMKAVKVSRRVRHEEKVTVATQHGSLVANGLLVSTLCGDAFEDGEEFEAAVPAWRALHSIASPEAWEGEWSEGRSE